jgi:RND family efflux transporter MFP subunit
MGNTVRRSGRRSSLRAAATLALAALAVLVACSRGKGETGADGRASRDARSADSAESATPVHMAAAELGDITIMVSGPGQTGALDLQKVRAPFTGTIASLQVLVGDHVGDGQVIGAIVSQPSQAALTGAEAMLAAARTPRDSSDAQRALVLARQNLIETPLRAPRAGIVVSRGASQGDLVSQGDSIASIAAAGSIAFVARIGQTDLGQVRPGQRAILILPGSAVPVDAVVHGLLPADTSGSLTVPVRLDLLGAPSTSGVPIQAGLFGMAQITVGRRHQVPIVPISAVLRDDVSGTTRMAVVMSDGRAHWVTVTTGASQGDRIEITSPVLAPGARVIVSGQVGLPDGRRVREIGTAGSATS